MKKSLTFILVLLIIFTCLYTKLSKDYHVIPAKPTTQATTPTQPTKKENEIVEYNFTKNTTVIPADIKTKADAISKSYNAIGIQVAVMKNHELLYTYEYGYSDYENGVKVVPDNKFRVASMAKFVTDAVFMKLCDLGKVSIDADISDYLGFKVRNPYYPDIVITPALLMSHCGTVVDSDAFSYSLYNNSSSTIEEILNSPGTLINAKPGTYYYYSNFSVAVIGAICEKVTGKYFYQLAKEYLFEPLEIDAAYLASELENTSLLANLYGDGGLEASLLLAGSVHPTIGQTHHIVQGNLIISAKDYLKFLAMISAGGITEKGERILSEKSIEQMLISRVYADGLGYGFGVEENKLIFKNHTLYSHPGYSYGLYSTYLFNPETGDGIVILTSGCDYVDYVDDAGFYNICQEYVNLMFPKQQ